MKNMKLTKYDVVLRNETAEDIDSITEVTVEAFKNHPISRQTEHYIINALRSAGALKLSLVAIVNGKIVGHIAFSPIQINDGTTEWYGLGPVSVFPDYQKQGIGKALITEGLSLIKDMGGQGCALVGDPKYYDRFGFRNYSELIHEGIPQEVFLALPFAPNCPKGIVDFHEGFGATE